MLYPPHSPIVDYVVAEDWKQEGDVWRPGDFQVTVSDPSAVTEWQVVNGGSAFIAAVGLPELAVAVGFPAAVFISVQMAHPSLNNGIDPKGAWALNIDVAQALDQAVLSPISSYLGANGVSFVAYVRGIVKNLDLPVVRLALNAFWTTGGYTEYSGYLVSNVTVTSPFIESAPVPVEALEVCPRCKGTQDGFVMLAHPTNTWP